MSMVEAELVELGPCLLEPPRPSPRGRSFVRDVPLPEVYLVARMALERAARLDEVADWADRSLALMAYARVSRDRTLEVTAKRIRLRAVRRAGQLLLKIPAMRGKRTDRSSEATTRTRMAERAGFSRQQHRVAIQVASIPEAAFEAAVEARNPTGVMVLARMGHCPDSPPPADPAHTRDRLAGLALARRVRVLEGALAGADIERLAHVLDPAERRDLAERLILLSTAGWRFAVSGRPTEPVA